MDKLLFTFTLNGNEYKVFASDCINDEKDIMRIYNIYRKYRIYKEDVRKSNVKNIKA